MGVKHPEYVLIAAIVCCFPMIPAILSDEVSGITAAERFLIALVVCWVLGSLLSFVIRTYNAQAQRAQLLRLIETDDPAQRLNANPTTLDPEN